MSKKLILLGFLAAISGCITVNTTPSGSPTPQPSITPSPEGSPSPSAVPSPTPIPSDAPKLTIGMNLGSPSYWDAESMFADVTDYTSGWWADNIGLQPTQIQPFSTTSDNYPTTDAQVLTNFVGFPTGLYRVSFDHNANTKIIIGWSESFKTVIQNQVDSAPDANGVIHTTYELPLFSGSPKMIYVHRVDPTKKDFLIKNFHIYAPDRLNSTSSFRIPFIAKLSPFNPIRMMGMNNTNDAKTTPPQVQDCPAKNWSDRTVASNFGRSNNSQVFQAAARDGATYEEEIELANLMKKDLWINIPDCATDDFVTQLATLFHNTLNPQRNLYLEYSNETWNTGFGQWYNIRDNSKSVAALQKLDDVTRVQIYTAYRLMQVMKIFQSVFRDRPQVLKGVLAGQLANTWTVSVGLDWLKSNVGDPKQWISYVSGAPYVGTMPADGASYDTPMQNYFHDSQTYLKSKLPADQAKAQADLQAALTALFATLNKWETTYNRPWFKQWKTMSDKYGIPVVAYEGGQSLLSAFASLSNQTVIQLDGTTKTGQTVYYQFDPMNQAQSDPRMADLYATLLNDWQSVFGNNPFVHLGFIANPTNWGFWGVWTDMFQDHSVKGDELLKLLGK